MKITKKMVFEIDYDDLNEFISAHYGCEYDILVDMELNNYSSQQFIVKSDPLNEREKRELDEYKATGDCNWVTPILLRDLCNRNIIEAGEYIVKVSW